jgi:hypothetical protein
MLGAVAAVATLLLGSLIGLHVTSGGGGSNTVLDAGSWSTIDFRDGLSFRPPPDDASPRLSADEAWQQFTGKQLSAPLYDGFRARLGILRQPEGDTLVWGYTGPRCAIEPTSIGPLRTPGPECRFWRFLDANTGLHVVEFQADTGDQ